LRFGFWESLIIADNAFNFTFLNPFSFLRSADYNAGENLPVNKNNALMGFDFEVQPVKNVALQASLLIDDFNFATLFNNNKNKKEIPITIFIPVISSGVKKDGGLGFNLGIILVIISSP